MSDSSPSPGEDPVSVDQPPAKKRRWPRVLLIVLIILGVAGYFFFRDDELQPVDDLSPRRAQIAWDDQNGWKRLTAFARTLPPIDSNFLRTVDRVLDLVEEPDQKACAKAAFTDAQLTQLEAIAETPRFQAPLGKVSRGLMDEVLGREVEDAGGPLRMQTSSIIAFTEAGSVEGVLRCLRVGSALEGKMSRDPNSVAALLSAGWINTAAVMRSLVRLDWTEDQLKELASLLEAEPLGEAEFQEAMRQEFHLMRNNIFGEGLPPFRDLESTGQAWVRRLLFRRNRSANLLAAMVRSELEPGLTAPWTEIQKLSELYPAWQGSLGDFLDPNLHGGMLVRLWYPGRSNSMVRQKLGMRRALRVIVALHRWHGRYGALPQKLEELVPGFLDAVPLDPFDFARLRWDPAKAAVQFLRETTISKTMLLDPVDQSKPGVIQGSGTIYLFRTKAAEAERRAAPPKVLRKPGAPRPAATTPAPATGPK